MGLAMNPKTMVQGEQAMPETIPNDVVAAGLKDLESKAIASIAAKRKVVGSYLANYKGQSGAAVIYSKLQEYGVDVVNGYSGGAILPLLDQFHEDHPRHKQEGAPTPIRWITNSNESSAGHIAEGIAKSAPQNEKDNKQPAGVIVATSGPGVTNLITPLQDAICDGVPLVVLCGQAATTAPPDAFQFAPAVDLTKPCTKWSYQIKSAAELPFVMDYAFYVARNGRPGPVFVDLPKDLQNQLITDESIEAFTSSLSVKGSSFPTPDDVTEDNSAVRLMQQPRVNGHIDHAVHLGDFDQGIMFEINNESSAIEPVINIDADEKEGQFQMDLLTTDKIYSKEGSDDFYVGSKSVTSLVDLIAQAEKPVIIAGNGCNDCPEELKKFAEKLQIPVATTLHSLGCYDERNDLALNMVGMHGHPTPNFMVQESDLIICVGSRFDDRITGRMSDFIPEAKKAAQEGRGGIIHVDIRLSQNARQVEPTYFIHSTGKKFLQTLNEEIESRETLSPITSDWIARMKDYQKEYPITIPKFPTQQITTTNENGEQIKMARTRMSAQSVVTMLDKLILEAGAMDDCIFSTGVGIHQMVAAQLITWTKPRQMLSSGSLGTMGVALGYCIGAKLANGEKMCIAIDGDGSFNMTFTELKTVAEQGIPVKIMILDNESQMMVEYWQRLFHQSRYLAVTNTKNPDYSTLADAFGIKNLYCDAEEDLEETMRKFLFEDPDKPVLFHVRIERTPCLPLVAPGQPLDDMILEDDTNCGDFDACAAPS
jgi:acetolactate synthase-1/2/3 large subunit